MPPLFPGPRLKVKRANKHIEDFNATIDDFVSTDFCELRIKSDAHSGNSVLEMRMTNDVPAELPAILGDAIHNLRVALDIAVCDLVSLAGESPSKWVKFPFAEDSDKLISAINGGQIKITGTDIIHLIVNHIRPYNAQGGNLDLCGLHDIDIDDKHRLIIPTISVATLVDCDFTAGGAAFRGNTLSVTDGQIMPVISFPGKFEVQNYGKATYEVTFDKQTPFPHQPIVPTLLQLSNLVTSILDAFEQVHLARRQI